MSYVLSVNSSYNDSNNEYDDEGDGDGTKVRRKMKFDML